MKLKHLLCVLLTVLVVLPLLTITAFATEREIVLGLTISDDKNKSSWSDGVYMATGEGGRFSAKENAVTIKNIGSVKASISFDYEAAGYGSFSIDGASVKASGSVEWILDAGASKIIKIKGTQDVIGGGTNGVLTLKNISYTPLYEGPATITYNDLGSVTVNGSAFASGSTTGTITETGAALAATPNSGACFVAWVKAGTNEIVSLKKSFALKPYATMMDIQAVFTTAASPAYYMTNSILYSDWGTALTAAKGGDKKVVVVGSGTLPAGTIDIPTGVTFLVPYDPSDPRVDSTTATVEGESSSTLEYANKKLVIANSTDMLMPYNQITSTLTIPSNTTVNVAPGAFFVVGGTICAGHESYIGITGGTAGAHSNVQLEGTLNVSGIVSSCGYILGNGEIKVASGATVYQPMVILDHKNGQYVAGIEDNIFPWHRYALQNIQCDVHMDSDATLKGYMDIYTATVEVSKFGITVTLPARHTVTSQTIIGPSDGLYTLKNGSVDISYSADRYVNDNTHNGLYNRVGTTTMEFFGNVTTGSMKMTVNVAGMDFDVSSATDFFPIPYNFQIHQKNGTFTVAQMIKLMPGALLHIHENATLNVTSKLAVMDSVSDHGDVSRPSSNSTTYARFRYPTADVLKLAPFSGNGTANLILDSTMTVAEGGAFGGVVQTNGGGRVTMNGTAGVQVKLGTASVVSVAATTANISGRTVYNLSPRLYITGENKTLEMETDKTYVGIDGKTHTIPSFDFILYTSASDTSATETVTGRELNANVTGTWKCETCKDEDKNHICEICGFESECVDVAPEGAVYADHICDVCGKAVGECADDEDEDTLCNICGKNLCTHEGEGVKTVTEKVAPTCETDGTKAYWTCAICHFNYSDEACTVEIPDLDAWKADTTETGGCIPATGHTYGEPAYTWEGTTLTVTLTCDKCAEGTENKVLIGTAAGEETSSTEGDCQTKATVTYTATVTLNDKIYTNETTIEGKLGEHALVKTEAKAATCTATGNSEYYTCSVEGCGKVFKADKSTETTVEAETIQIADHTPGEPVEENRVEETCTADGSYDKVIYCSVCKTHVIERNTITVASQGHSYENGKCTVCGEADPNVSTAPTIAVTNPANGTGITHDIVETDNGWTLTLIAEDTAKTYVYLVKYTDADGVESEKIAKADGKYTDGEFVIPADATAVTVESALLGDVNLNGKVNITDAQEAHKAAAKITTLSGLKFLAADVNSNNKVNATDAQTIHKYAAKVISSWN